MIHTSLNKNKNIEYLVGGFDIKITPQVPYNNLSLEFLDELSKALRNHKQIKEYPDIMGFAFWCRKANISKLKTNFSENKTRLGVGLVFHITPSNVPVNFAFSFVFGLLSGNANIVRVPSKPFMQTDIICSEINKIFENKKYSLIKSMTSFVKYEKDDDITAQYSQICNARVIWGGDKTIWNIRKLPISARCVDIAFADRFSFSIINSDELIKISENDLARLVEGFYNDTYLMDQNACSSPHLVLWFGKNKQEAQNKFWNALYLKVKNMYKLSLIMAVDKYTHLCENAIDMNSIKNYKSFDNLLYILKLNNLSSNIENYHGKFGYFFEYEVEKLDDISSIINNKYQTLTYYKVDKNQIKDFIVNNALLGIDRVVPIGQAMDMTVIWDGYDIVKNLSRIVDIK